MTPEEQKAADALTKIGKLWIGPNLKPNQHVCIYCGHDNVDFCADNPLRCFHVDCFLERDV